ncbi:hypothetical protein ACFX13_015790 [Malus domestica]
MDSDPSGRILFTVKNLFSFLHLVYCLLETVFCSRGRGFQPLQITTLEIVNDGAGERYIKTLCSVVRDLGIQISGGFEHGYCFQFKDLELEEDNKCGSAMVQWTARRRGQANEKNKFIRQFDDFELSGDRKAQKSSYRRKFDGFELSGDRKVQLKLVQQLMLGPVSANS